MIPIEVIEKKIYIIRGEKVMLDSDLAALYETETRILIKAVKRNIDSFPKDFMIELTDKEFNNLKSQIGTSSSHGGRRKLPHAFTEQGVAMLSSVLNSDRAVKVNIEIMRAFVNLRRILSSNVELSKRLDELEKKYDKQFQVVFQAIRELMTPSGESPQRKIGFKKDE